MLIHIFCDYFLFLITLVFSAQNPNRKNKVMAK